ncbi:hypothetical protein BKA67DRAFT_660710 [Truncatella angustata]|uniref:Uncharacterized protein n=1 Tax=Truncatella angustata TaxID=152316 RepID=A0A9P8ZVG3_9PEZI|nr:uncharacterized protein BKA67DRAFT_660710 [Truncatella angustata]KAH6651931.1 hypothetical protein BKA67DRAFT_660710 [Truncatella angustata]KAH8205660.1 hypothetical protein TruAng_000154 [Truncatella angustata]
MSVHLRPQKKYGRVIAADERVTARLPTCKGWGLLSRVQKQTIRLEIRSHISAYMYVILLFALLAYTNTDSDDLSSDEIIDDLAVGTKLDYEELAEDAIRTVFEKNLDIFSVKDEQGNMADDSLVVELM